MYENIKKESSSDMILFECLNFTFMISKNSLDSMVRELFLFEPLFFCDDSVKNFLLIEMKHCWFTFSALKWKLFDETVFPAMENAASLEAEEAGIP